MKNLVDKEGIVRFHGYTAFIDEHEAAVILRDSDNEQVFKTEFPEDTTERYLKSLIQKFIMATSKIERAF